MHWKSGNALFGILGTFLFGLIYMWNGVKRNPMGLRALLCRIYRPKCWHTVELGGLVFCFVFMKNIITLSKYTAVLYKMIL